MQKIHGWIDEIADFVSLSRSITMHIAHRMINPVLLPGYERPGHEN
jgi:hypothetical protein